MSSFVEVSDDILEDAIEVLACLDPGIRLQGVRFGDIHGLLIELRERRGAE